MLPTHIGRPILPSALWRWRCIAIGIVIAIFQK